MDESIDFDVDQVSEEVGAKPFPLTMVHHLIRSLLMKADDDLSLLVVVHNNKAKEAIKEMIWRLNSMSYDERRPGVFIAKNKCQSASKTLVMVDEQTNSLFINVRDKGNAMRTTKVITQGELISGTALAELATERDAECFALV